MKLGELLLNSKIITQDHIDKALEEQKKTGKRIGHCLTSLGFLKNEDALFFLSKQHGIPGVDLSKFTINRETLKIIPSQIARKYRCIPLFFVKDTLTLAMMDKPTLNMIDDLEFLIGINIEPILTTEALFEVAFKKNYKKRNAASDLITKDYTSDLIKAQESYIDSIDEEAEEEMLDSDDFDDIVKGAIDNIEVIEEEREDIHGEIFRETDAPIVKLVNGILIEAVKSNASDIHVEPFEHHISVRFRIDGTLRKVMTLPTKVKHATASRIKIISKMNIAEKRLPQDGRIKLQLGKKQIYFRVSAFPTVYGEKIVIRVLNKSNLQLDLAVLGFEPDELKKFGNAIRRPYGMVLVTGPTGSGKTTTLYSALAQLQDETINIMTAEDPVEFDIGGINQGNMNDQIGLTFAAALRSFLRQDPDVILVGEIRDYETASIAVKAALTGHMVLSTLHTNDAPSTIVRLIDMGISSYLVTSAVILVVAQRLVRKICTKCKVAVNVPASLLYNIGFSEEQIKQGITVFKGKGCQECSNKGYKGRLALYEIMEITLPIKELIIQGATTDKLREIAEKEGMLPLRKNGLKKVKEGLTTIDEVLGVTV